jgi:hypothetical protein
VARCNLFSMGHDLGRLIEFFLRLAFKFARRIGTGDWPVYKSIVIYSRLETSFTGCLVVTIRYKYRNADTRYDGTYKQPFVNVNYAEAYLRRHPGGSEFPVIVSPHLPSWSIPVEGKIEFVKAG